MRIRNSLTDLVKEGKYQTTSYGTWEKRSYPDVLDTLGYEKGLVMYVNQETNMAFYIQFSYGIPSLNLYAPVFSGDGFTKLYSELQRINKRQEPSRLLQWDSWYRGDRSTCVGSTEAREETIYDLTLDSRDSNNIELLNSCVEILSKAIQFPAGMLEDIKNEVQKYFLPQEKIMWKLTNKLVNKNDETRQQIRKVFNFDILNGSTRAAIKWIRALREQGYLYEALLWCNVFTKKERNRYSHVLEMAKEILMQIEGLKESATEYVFPLGDNGRDLSYKESLFKIAWKIAVSSGLEDDKILAVRFLNEISGQANFIFGEELPNFASADLLINQAKTLKKLSDRNKTLLEENRDLKERIQTLESKQPKMSQLGTFGKPSNKANADCEAIEETNKYSF